MTRKEAALANAKQAIKLAKEKVLKDIKMIQAAEEKIAFFGFDAKSCCQKNQAVQPPQCGCSCGTCRGMGKHNKENHA